MPPAIKRVVVRYADGTRAFCDSPAEWEQSSDHGVVLVQVLYDKTRKGKYLQELLAGHDYYWERDSEYFGGSAKVMPTDVPEQSIKHGVWVRDPEFQRLYNEACEGVAIETE